jgi:hypothetical protein
MLERLTKHLKSARAELCAQGPLALVRRLAARVVASFSVKRRTKDLVAWMSKDNPTAVKVAVHGTWDIDDALRYLTPNGSGSWGPVRFRRAAGMQNPDFHLILNAPRQKCLRLFAPPERIWFAAGEPPPIHVYQVGQGSGTTVLTCDPQVAANPPSDRSVLLTHPVLCSWSVRRTFDELTQMEAVHKTKRLSWVTSNGRGWAGAKRRMEFLEAIRGKVAFDLYGRGFDEISDKWQGIAPYQYSIAFENYCGSHYFSEKIMDCFVCLTLPLYYGCTEIGKFFPEQSFVRIDPDNPHVAEIINDVISSDVSKNALEALREAKWLVLYKYNMFSQITRLMLENVGPAGPAKLIDLAAP